MNARTIIASTVTLFALALTGCNNHAGLDAAAAERIERNAAISALVHDYDQARAAQQWDLALSYASKLQHLAPGSALANTVWATLIDTGVRADELKDKQSLAALWTYNTTEATGDASDGVLVTASIQADDKSDPEGSSPARLVLRRHPKWGRSLSLVLDHGEFDCAPGCKVQVRFDDQPTHAVGANKLDQNKQSLTIGDEQNIRDALDKVRVITIDTSVDGKPRSLSFEVGGFDRVQLERQLQ
jgi:outer membrane murein-binding lipoprotein Lpp